MPVSEQPEKERRRRLRVSGIRIFSSASDAPRARRPTDAVLLFLTIVGVALLSIPAPGPTKLDKSVSNLIKDVPGLLGWFWEVAYDLLVGWALVLLLIALFAHRRKRLFLDELLAGALALGFTFLAGDIAGTEWSTSLRSFVSSSSPPIYLATRMAIATSIVVTASPHMARPMKFIGRWLLFLGALASIALGVTQPIGLAAGFLIGFGSAALVHLLVGSPGGRLTIDQVAQALVELDVGVTNLRDAPLQPRGSALEIGETPDGRSLLIKVFGRDAWDGQLITSIWTSLSRRGETVHLGQGRLQQVEHEAFVTLLAERGGVPVMPVVVAGMAAQGDALLVLEMTGRSFSSVDPDDIDDQLLGDLWAVLGRLHGLEVAHRQVTGEHLIVRSDGSPAIGEFSSARIAANDGELLVDRAQLLVTTALAAGKERAVSAAALALGNQGLAEVLPYLQPAVFDRETKQAIHAGGWKIKELRTLVAEQTGAEPPALEQIRRVTWRSILKLALIVLIAYGLWSAFSGISIQELIDEFQKADWAWLVAALIVTPFVQIPQAFSTLGATLQTISFKPVLMLQYGVQFMALAVPSSAARVAFEIRFFERVGVPSAAAVSISMIDSFSTFLIQITLILVITLSGLASLDLSSSGSSSGSDSSSSSGSSSSPNWEAIAIALGLLIIALIVAYAVPRFRVMLKRFREVLRQKAADGREALRVLRHPSKLFFLFGGNFVVQIMLAIVLGLCLKAFGQSATLAQLVLVNTFVTLFAGFMPVPGGVGVAEAGYTAGLVAIGIPEAAATSTAIAYRAITFYIPPIWGAFATRWMRANSYL